MESRRVPMSSESIDLIRKLSLDLQHRRAEIETIFDLLPIGIAISDDPECRRIRGNRAFAALVGLEDAAQLSLRGPELPGGSFAVFKDGRKLDAEERPMRRAVTGAAEVPAVTLDVVHPDGRRVSLMEYALPLFD